MAGLVEAESSSFPRQRARRGGHRLDLPTRRRVTRAATATRRALLVLFACGVVCVFAARGASADPRFGDSTWVAPGIPSDSASATDGPRVAPPDHERGWETALRAPFRVVFYPLRLVGIGLEAGAAYVGPRYFDPKPELPPKRGPQLSPYIAPTAANDIGLGVAVTWRGLPTADSRLHAAAAWSIDDRRRASFDERIGDRRPVGFDLRADYDYKPNRRFYGIGNATTATDKSYFLLAGTSVEAALLLGASPLRQLRIGSGSSDLRPGAGYNAEPLLEEVFPPASAPYSQQATQTFWYGLAGDFAKLDDARDPSLGVHLRADVRRVDGVQSGDPDYDEWRTEVRGYLPVFAKRRVMVVRGVYTGVDPGGDATTGLPFYRLPRSEGINQFAGFASERFRDQQLVLARFEYRWFIVNRLSALALYELGEVAPRSGAFTLADTHISYGGGVRFGLSDRSVFRFELANSVEGLHAVFALGSDF